MLELVINFNTLENKSYITEKTALENWFLYYRETLCWSKQLTRENFWLNSFTKIYIKVTVAMNTNVLNISVMLNIGKVFQSYKHLQNMEKAETHFNINILQKLNCVKKNMHVIMQWFPKFFGLWHSECTRIFPWHPESENKPI